jgi:hypothetical protein
MGIKLEYSSARISQRNKKIEQNFQTLYGQLWKMSNSARITDDLGNGIGGKFSSNQTFHSNNAEKVWYQVIL